MALHDDEEGVAGEAGEVEEVEEEEHDVDLLNEVGSYSDDTLLIKMFEAQLEIITLESKYLLYRTERYNRKLYLQYMECRVAIQNGEPYQLKKPEDYVEEVHIQLKHAELTHRFKVVSEGINSLVAIEEEEE